MKQNVMPSTNKMWGEKSWMESSIETNIYYSLVAFHFLWRAVEEQETIWSGLVI